MKVLLVEDDIPTATLLTDFLEGRHYLVNAVNDGLAGWELAQTYEYDVILLDVMVPRLDGLSLCRKLRAQGDQTPILLLTARDGTGDRVTGLEAGADDYVVKPFELAELLARIRAVLRRRSGVQVSVLTWERLRFNPDTGEVAYAGKPIHLTPKEYGMLELFLRHPQRIFSRSALLDRLWSADESPGEEAVTTHIKGLRQRLKAAGLAQDMIETIYGLGYRLKAAPAGEKVIEGPEPPGQAASLPTEPHPSQPHPQPSTAESRVMALMAAMRKEVEQTLPDRLQVFEQTISQLQQGRLDPEVQHQARMEAHKLVGTLGSLGLTRASQVGRQMETLLGAEAKLDKTTAAAQLTQLLSHLRGAIAEPEPPPAPFLPPPGAVPSPTPVQLLIVDDDRVLTQQLTLVASQQGWQVTVAANLATARKHLAQKTPDLILLDLTFPESGENGLTFLAELAEQQRQVPILVMTAHNQLTERLEVLRLGAQGFLHKPVAPDQVFQALAQILQRNQTAEAKILVVDDDPVILTNLQALLQPWGFQVITLADPQQFWQFLEASVPDLLILDIEMPTLNGIQLCQVVRNDLHWGQLPILVLSVHQDAATIHQVFTAGADDYVHKPVVGPELIARILNRLERRQILQKLAETKRRDKSQASTARSTPPLPHHKSAPL